MDQFDALAKKVKARRGEAPEPAPAEPLDLPGFTVVESGSATWTSAWFPEEPGLGSHIHVFDEDLGEDHATPGRIMGCACGTRRVFMGMSLTEAKEIAKDAMTKEVIKVITGPSVLDRIPVARTPHGTTLPKVTFRKWASIPTVDASTPLMDRVERFVLGAKDRLDCWPHTHGHDAEIRYATEGGDGYIRVRCPRYPSTSYGAGASLTHALDTLVDGRGCITAHEPPYGPIPERLCLACDAGQRLRDAEGS